MKRSEEFGWTLLITITIAYLALLVTKVITEIFS